MIQQDLLSWTTGDRDGATYSHALDFARLNTQAAVVFRLMMDGQWRTPAMMEEATGYNWSSINARLRDFRKSRFGCHTVDVRPIGGGLNEYRLLVNRQGVAA